MIGPLLRRLDEGEGVTEISEYLWFELEDHFGLDPAVRDLRVQVFPMSRDITECAPWDSNPEPAD